MASPDFQQYIDLTINDVQPPEIYESAIEYALTSLPEFSPRQGTVEDALLQAMAFISGLSTGAINRLPNALMEGVLRLIGLERDEATFASGNVIFNIIDNNGAVIPSGTQISFLEIVDDITIQHVFQTVSEANVPLGDSSSSLVPIVAVSPGEKPFIPDDSPMIILAASNRLLSCTFSGTIVQGDIGESDQNYFTRGTAYLGTLSEALVTVSQINNNVLLSYPSVERALTVDNARSPGLPGVQIFETSGTLQASCAFDPLDFFDEQDIIGDLVRVSYAEDPKFNKTYEVTQYSTGNKTVFFSNTAGASSGETYDGPFEIELLKTLNFDTEILGGTTTTVVAGVSGGAIPKESIEEIKQGISSKLIAGLNYDVVNALIVPVNIQIFIKVLNGFDEVATRSAVDQAITEFVSPDQWEWSQRVRLNSILSRSAQISGVEYVQSVEMSISQSELNAEIDNTTGDIIFLRQGTLPLSSVSVAVI